MKWLFYLLLSAMYVGLVCSLALIGILLYKYGNSRDLSMTQLEAAQDFCMLVQLSCVVTMFITIVSIEIGGRRIDQLRRERCQGGKDHSS